MRVIIDDYDNDGGGGGGLRLWIFTYQKVIRREVIPKNSLNFTIDSPMFRATLKHDGILKVSIRH